MWRTEAQRLLAAIVFGALLPFAGPAAAAAPTAQELLAAQDQDLAAQMRSWGQSAFAVPEDQALDAPLRLAATELAQAHIARLQRLWPVWIAQERAASSEPNPRSNALSLSLYARAINEMAIWTIESAGQAHDQAWLQAALAPLACSSLYPSHFARHLAMIQAAPIAARPALLAAERELLSRWGSPRKDLPAPPSPPELEGADQAIVRLRAGLPISAEPMTPFLADQVFRRNRKPGRSDRWEQCAKSQWWLASQLANGKTDRTAALTLFRYSTMLDARELVPAAFLASAGAVKPADGQLMYPPEATYFEVEGTTTLQADKDADGKLLKTRVVARKIKVPGVRDNPPLAFETLFDAASLDFARKRSYPADKDLSLKFELVWRLAEGKDAAQ